MERKKQKQGKNSNTKEKQGQDMRLIQETCSIEDIIELTKNDNPLVRLKAT